MSDMTIKNIENLTERELLCNAGLTATKALAYLVFWARKRNEQNPIARRYISEIMDDLELVVNCIAGLYDELYTPKKEESHEVE